jgi:arogenate dehydrogenase (NADP+)
MHGMTVGIYGLGRFGSFWARALASRCEVLAWSRDPARQAPEGVRRVRTEDELLALPVVIYCVTISAFEEVLGRTAGRLAPGALVMDTCSVKVLPVRAMERLLPPEVSILGTHPMFGPDSARQGLQGLPMVLCPSRVADEELARWQELFAGMGLAVLAMRPEEHDRQAAWTQGVTHYVGRVLKDLGIGPSPLATVGYRRLLETVEQTCNDPWQLFLDLQRYNPYTREMRGKLRASLDSVMAAIGDGSP